MRLLSPMALAWAGIALPIIGLYILRIRRRRQIVPSLMFWDQIFHDTAPRSLWRRMRHWLSLLLQLAFLLLLVLALADPVSTGQSARPVHYELVMDLSASMRTTDGTPTRFDQAREHALRVIDGMRDQDEATIIGAGRQPAIVCARTHHQPTLRAAIRSMTAVDTSADLNAAVRLADSIAFSQGERSIVLITDAAGLNSVDAGLAGRCVPRLCGRQTNNAGITGLAVRPRSDDPLELQGMLRVANDADLKTTAEVKLTLNGDLFDVALVELAPGEEKIQTFRMVNSGGGILRATLSAADALMSDNRAAAVLPDTQKKNVVLVSEGDLFLESVLASHPWMQVRRIKPQEWKANPPDTDILVFDGFVPDPLPATPSLFIYPTRPSRLWTLGPEIRNPFVSDLADDDAKLLRHVNLRNCTFHRALTVKPDAAGKALVSSFENPLLVRWAGASPPAVLLAINIKASESDLPWRTAFPILMQNALNYLAGAVEEPASEHQTGEAVTLAAASPDLKARDEKGRPIPVSVHGMNLTVGPVDDVGVVKVTDGQRTRNLAFNLADSRESELRATPTTQSAERSLASLPQNRFAWPWWVVLVTLGIALSVMEWGLHQRRVID